MKICAVFLRIKHHERPTLSQLVFFPVGDLAIIAHASLGSPLATPPQSFACAFPVLFWVVFYDDSPRNYAATLDKIVKKEEKYQTHKRGHPGTKAPFRFSPGAKVLEL